MQNIGAADSNSTDSSRKEKPRDKDDQCLTSKLRLPLSFEVPINNFDSELLVIFLFTFCWFHDSIDGQTELVRVGVKTRTSSEFKESPVAKTRNDESFSTTR